MKCLRRSRQKIFEIVVKFHTVGADYHPDAVHPGHVVVAGDRVCLLDFSLTRPDHQCTDDRPDYAEIPEDGSDAESDSDEIDIYDYEFPPFGQPRPDIEDFPTGCTSLWRVGGLIHFWST